MENLRTGQQSKPLAELQRINEERRQQTENGLLKEALAISNEKCNSLIERQNMLVKGLTENVNEIKSDNSFYAKKLGESVQTAVREMRGITQDERQFKAEISQTIKREIALSANEVKCYVLQQVDETLTEVREQLKSTAKEIERERSDMKIERGFRKFMFWATPILLLAQTFAILFLILR